MSNKVANGKKITLTLTISGTKDTQGHITVSAPEGVTCDLSKVRDAATAWKCTATGYVAGDTIITFTVTDKAGNTTTKNATISYDNVPPTGTIGITTVDNNVAALQLNCQGTGSACTSMRFSSNNKNWSSWEAYSEAKSSWKLEKEKHRNSGARTVYVKFRDAAGNVSVAIPSDGF